MLPTKYRFFWTSVFREYFLEPDQLETKIAYGGHAYKRIGTNCAIVIANVQQMIPTKFPSIWPSGFREEDLLKSTNQKKEIACDVQVC